MVIGETSQRALTIYLVRQGLSAAEIHIDLVATLGPESVSYPSVTHYLRQEKFATPRPSVIFSEPEPGFDVSDEDILRVLSE
jgi:hypothetical protein